MEPAVWIPIAVGIGGLLLAFHRGYSVKRDKKQEKLEKLIEERVEMCITDVVSELREITAKLNNGVLQSTQRHTENIQQLRIDVAKLTVNVQNLTGQVEQVILGDGRKT